MKTRFNLSFLVIYIFVSMNSWKIIILFIKKVCKIVRINIGTNNVSL